MTGAGGGGAFTGMSAACAVPPSIMTANVLSPSKNNFRMKAPFQFCSPPLQAYGMQSYREEGQRSVTTEQRQAEFSK
jgi:hypothetical protein